MPTKTKKTSEEVIVDKKAVDNDLKATKMSGSPIVSAEQLELTFQKAHLKSDIHNLFVAVTDKPFTIGNHMYDGKEYFIVMFGPGQTFGVEKKFFNMIAQIMPTPGV